MAEVEVPAFIWVGSFICDVHDFVAGNWHRVPNAPRTRLQLIRLSGTEVERALLISEHFMAQSAARLGVRTRSDGTVVASACLYSARICRLRGSRTVVPPRGVHEICGPFTGTCEIRRPYEMG